MPVLSLCADNAGSFCRCPPPSASSNSTLPEIQGRCSKAQASKVQQPYLMDGMEWTYIKFSSTDAKQREVVPGHYFLVHDTSPVLARIKDRARSQPEPGSFILQLA